MKAHANGLTLNLKAESFSIWSNFVVMRCAAEGVVYSRDQGWRVARRQTQATRLLLHQPKPTKPAELLQEGCLGRNLTPEWFRFRLISAGKPVAPQGLASFVRERDYGRGAKAGFYETRRKEYHPDASVGRREAQQVWTSRIICWHDGSSCNGRYPTVPQSTKVKQILTKVKPPAEQSAN